MLSGKIVEPLSHFLRYAVLVGFASVGCNSFTNPMYVFLGAILISISWELAQLVVPERGFRSKIRR